MDYHATYRSHWQHIRHWYQQKQRPIQILINAQSADAAAASHTFMKLLRSNCIKFDVHPILGCNLLSELGLVVSANATMVSEAEAMIMLDSDSSDDDGEGAGSVPPREAGDDEEVEAVHYEEEGGSYKFVTKKITKRQQRIQQWKEERRGRREVSGEGGSRGNSNNNSRIETMWVLIGIGATVDINKIFNMKLDVYQEAITVSKSATSPAALATRPVCYVHIIDSTRPYHLSNIQHDAIPIGVGPSSVSHEWRFLQIWGGEQVRLEAGEFFKEKVGSGHWRRRESRYHSNGGLVKSGAGNVSEGGQSKRRRKAGKRARTSMEADERGDSVQGGIDNNITHNDSNSVTSQQGVPAEEDIDSSDISSNNSDHDDENNSKDDDGSSSSLSISSDEDLTDQTALLDQWHSKGDTHTTSRAKSSIPSSLFWLRDPAAAGVTNKYREQYYCVHASGPSAALIIHLLCSDVNGGVRGVSVGDAQDSLWAAAIGITDLYMQNMLNEEAYLLHLADLRAEITDLMSSNGNNNINNTNNNANNGDAQVVLNPYVREYQALPLLRHWTLWDSMWHNKDIAKLLELHSDSRGEAVLMGFLATEGISIDEAQQEWTSVTPEKRSHILTVLKEKLMSLVWLVRSLPSNRLSIKNHNSDGINNNTNNTLLTTSTSIYSAPFLTSFEISTISRKMGFSAEITSFDVCRIFYGVIGRRVPDHIAASAVSVFMTGGTDTSQNNNNNKQFDEYQRETFWEARDVLLASSHDPIFTRAVADTRQLYNHISHAARSMLTLRSRSLWRSRTLWFQTSLSSGEATQGVGSSSIGGSGHYILDSFWIPVRLGALADHLLIALNIKIPNNNNNNNNNNNKSLSDSAVRPLQPRPLVLHCPLPIPPLPPTQSSAHVPQRQDLHLILLSYNRYVIGSGGESPCTSVVPIVRTAVAAAEDSEHFPNHNIVFVSSGVTGHGRWWVIRGKDAARQFIEIMSL